MCVRTLKIVIIISSFFPYEDLTASIFLNDLANTVSLTVNVISYIKRGSNTDNCNSSR